MTPAALRARHADLALLVVCATVAMLFVGFAAALVVRRSGPDWHAHPLPGPMWAGVAGLLASSVALEAARRRPGAGWWAVVVVSAVGFAAGQALGLAQWAGAGRAIAAGPHVAFVWTLATVHACHLVGGGAALAWAARRPAALPHVAGFWHFLGAVWCACLGVLS